MLQDGIIESVVQADQVQASNADRVIDVGGRFIAPGFIDIHVHDGGGYDIMTGTPEAIEGLARLHLAHGTTTIFPTTTTGTLEMAQVLTERDILCAIAHNDALCDQILEAYEHGLSLVTHLYSGCSSVRRVNAFRYTGVIEAAYLLDEMAVEIMAAGLGPGEYRRRDADLVISDAGSAVSEVFVGGELCYDRAAAAVAG